MNKLLRHAVPLFLFVGLLGVPRLLHSQQTPTASSPAPVYNTGPVTDYQAALPNSNDVLQFRRGERYNIPYPSLPELGDGSETAIWDLPESHFTKDPTPFKTSDVVVIGTVSSGQSHLSNDKRNIYSEFKVSLQEVLKNSPTHYLRANDSIDIQRKGGSIRLPSGKILTRAALADSMPQIGGRYLLFLKYDQDTEDYTILMAYQLSGNEVYRLDTLSFKENHNPQTARQLHKEDINKSQFLDRMRSAPVAPKGGN
jgi:hypothetical protein